MNEHLRPLPAPPISAAGPVPREAVTGRTLGIRCLTALRTLVRRIRRRRASGAAAVPSPVRPAPAVSHLEPLPDLTAYRARRLFVDDTGAATAEYAIATMATVAHYWQIWGAGVTRPSNSKCPGKNRGT